MRRPDGTSRSTLCSRHRNQQQRQANPVAAYYQWLKDSAKRRRLPFEISRTEWAEWCGRVGFFSDRQKDYAERLSVDRINPRQGYTLANIQALTVSENAAKRDRTTNAKRKVYTPEPIPDDPIDRI